LVTDEARWAAFTPSGGTFDVGVCVVQYFDEAGALRQNLTASGGGEGFDRVTLLGLLQTGVQTVWELREEHADGES
jgi:hypothetical protein